MRRLLTAMGAAATLVLPVPMAIPNAGAAPEIPDLDSLIDDSGPVPATAADLAGIPDLAFTTPSGLSCRKSRGKVTHSLACAGSLPGAPAGTRSVSLASVYAQGDGPAVFLPTAPDGLLGDPARIPKIMLMPGHKIVFWDLAAAQSLVCGVPPGVEMACVLKSPNEIGSAGNSGMGPAVSHGFVIAAPQSRVF